MALKEKFPAIEDTVGAEDALVGAALALGVFAHAAFEPAFCAFPVGHHGYVHAARFLALVEGFLLFADLQSPCT